MHITYRSRMLLIVLGVVAAIAIACGTDDAPAAGPPADGGETTATTLLVVVDAPIVDSVVQISPGDPPAYTVEVTSGLPNACNLFNAIDVDRDGANVNVRVTNTRPAPSAEPLACAEIYGMVEHSVELPGEFEPGVEYSATVNGEVTRFVGISSADLQAPESRSPSDFIFDQIVKRDPGAARGDEVPQPFFSVAGERLVMFGEDIQVFEFDSAAEAEKASGGISADASSIVSTDGAVSSPLWVATPHFYRHAGAIVLYVGENVAITGLLEEIGAEKFAEGTAGGLGLLPPPAIPADPHQDIDTLAEYRELLEQLPVGEPRESDIFAVPTIFVKISGEVLQISVFPSAEAASRAAKSISSDGDTTNSADGSTTTHVDFAAPPHFYRGEEIITLYVGDNGAILDLLDRAAGKIFAGGGWSQILEPVEPGVPVESGIPKGFVSEEAPIASVEIMILEKLPPVYIASVTVGLPSGCVTFGAFMVKRDGRILSIQMLNKRPSDAEICTSVYGMEDVQVPLQGPFEPGIEFDVIVNGERQGTFVGQG